MPVHRFVNKISRKEKMTNKTQELQLALELAEEGQDRSLENAKEEWIDHAYEAIIRVAKYNKEFIVDKVWDYMDGDVHTHEKRAMGALIRDAARNGIIEPTDKYQPSTQKNCHGNPRRVWRSTYSVKRIVIQ